MPARACEPLSYGEVGQAVWGALRQRPCQVMAENGQDRWSLNGAAARLWFLLACPRACVPNQ